MAPAADPERHADYPLWLFSNSTAESQGSQWVGMGRRLVLAEPAFAAALARCDRSLAPNLGWSVFEEILAGAPRAEHGAYGAR